MFFLLLLLSQWFCSVNSQIRYHKIQHVHEIYTEIIGLMQIFTKYIVEIDVVCYSKIKQKILATVALVLRTTFYCNCCSFNSKKHHSFIQYEYFHFLIVLPFDILEKSSIHSVNYNKFISWTVYSLYSDFDQTVRPRPSLRIWQNMWFFIQ